MEGFRSKPLSYYVEEAADHYDALFKKFRNHEAAAAILASATATYNRAWFTELFWQDFQQMNKDHSISTEAS